MKWLKKIIPEPEEIDLDKPAEELFKDKYKFNPNNYDSTWIAFKLFYISMKQLKRTIWEYITK